MTVAAVIVSYNGWPHLGECIASLAADGVDRIIVADNASTDDSMSRLASTTLQAEVVETGGNHGYGGGANRGAAALAPSPPDYLLVCNQDTVVRPGTVKALVAALDADRRLGIAGPSLENLDGSTYPSARTFPALGDAIGHAFLGLFAPNNRFTRRYRLLDRGHEDAGEVDWVSGAWFMTRWSCWAELGGFDESYFMYLEDVDLCWRAGDLGWGVCFEPAGRVTHVQGTATSQHPYRMLVAHHRSMLHFASRTTTGWQRLLLPLMAVGLVVRTALACLEHWIAARRPGRRQKTTPLL